ncbi:Uncharacterised protein [uncultured Clostridium sp.]|uniref:hypothetical protein n=1 Tax=uncultured Clostridium sp. TaxID=59620 RepID=UPI0008234C22|nr:hypothetical protein [uncultured Clostridium sp.]SCJ99817.1 Uncharacterised protein [uncultured Clostridium sp.]
MSNNQTYSYIEKRMVDDDSNSIKFDPNHHKNYHSSEKVSVGVKVICTIIILATLYLLSNPFAQTSSKSKQAFLNDISYSINLSNEIMNTIVTEFNNNNFSTSHKNLLTNKLSLLESYTLDNYKSSKFNSLKLVNTQIQENIKNSINLILNSNNADQYLSGYLNSNLSLLRSNYDLYRDSLISFFEDNNILYSFSEDGSYTYQILK